MPNPSTIEVDGKRYRLKVSKPKEIEVNGKKYILDNATTSEDSIDIPSINEKAKIREPADDTISLKVAANEVYKELLKARMYVIISIVMFFLILIGDIFAPVFGGSLIVLASVAVAGYFLFTWQRRMQQLKQNYGL